MPDEADAQVASSDACRRRVLERARIDLGPRHRAFGELPAQEVTETSGWLASGVEEALTVEVIAQWTAVIEATLVGACARSAKKRKRSEQLYEPSAG